ncbi:MAG: FAD-containing monooxygenase EthA [Burkholderiales bacterium PBB4]|nr:MAG: FAD-containing monooxygenase EthA [Burkholderiales bacterium PBB4]
MHTPEHLDVIIVGAGLSGIGAAVHLQKSCPQQTYAILEARDTTGGTWDLFRYPGIRSDSDMYTLGYAFKPWTDAKAIADGPSILSYIRETAREEGVDAHIRCTHKVLRASWSSQDSRWTLEISRGEAGAALTLSCSFLWICSGYYRYDQGYQPAMKGTERFTGQMVHPQHWTPDIDYRDKRVVVIGSGATAITLVPSMAQTAAHVTMLQRSPTYVISLPAEDALANWLNRVLPARAAYFLTRWKKVMLGMLFYKASKRWPNAMKKMIVGGIAKAMGPDFDTTRHFSPHYKPWDQRVCMVPDADLFAAIKQGRASVVTDQIDTFTEKGILLKSGEELPADLVVTATGLDLLALGGMALDVDGTPVVLKEKLTYKGMMLSDVPNMAYVVGYTNASWTLKADLISQYVCRLLNHMRSKDTPQCTPRLPDGSVEAVNWVDFSSGYVQRSVDQFPRQGQKSPWCLHQNYALDIFNLRLGSLEDGTMRFSRPNTPPKQDNTL